jgi:hypothetical protein
MAKDILSQSMLKQFREGYNIQRRVTESASTSPGSPPNSMNIDQLISSRMRTMASRSSVGFKQDLLLITGHKDDGLSWACQQAAEAVEKENSMWQVTPLVGRRGMESLPEIIDEPNIGLKAAYRICRRLGLLPQRSFVASLRPLTLLISAVILSLPVAFFTYRLNQQDYTSNPLNVGIALGIIAFFTPLIAFLINQVKGQDEEELRGSLAPIFHEAPENLPPAYQNLRWDISKAYVDLYKPRCVLIDNFAHLDRFTQETVQVALAHPDIGSQGSLLWTVFETQDQPLLTRRVNMDPQFKRSLEGRISHFQIEIAAEPDRKTLAKTLGWPESRGIEQPLLKRLAHAYSEDDVRRLEQIWTGFLSIDLAGRAEAAEIVQLLASNAVYPEFALDWNECLSIFSAESGLFMELIREHRPSLHRHEVEEALGMLQKPSLSALFSHTGGAKEKIRIKPEVCNFIKPPEESKQTRMHLFWLLYWSRRKEHKAPSVRFEMLLLAHVVEIKTLSQILHSDTGVKIIEEYLEILSQASADCLDMTLMDEALHITRKLLTALQAITESRLVDDERLRRVWRNALIACWRAHIITRAEDILASLFTLLANVATRKGLAPLTDPAINGALQYLGLMGISEESGCLALSAKKDLGGRDQVVFDKVVTYLGVAWAELLYLFTAAFGAERLRNCGIATYDSEAASLLASIKWEDYDEKTIREQQEFRTLNRELINLFNYTYARSGQCKDPIDLYLHVMVFEDQPHHKTMKDYKHIDQKTLLEKSLQVESLASCLDTSLEVIRVALGNSHASSYYHPTPSRGYAFRSDIVPGPAAPSLNNIFEEILVNTLQERFPYEAKVSAPLSVALFEKIEDLYLRAALVWEHFSLEDLRNRALIHRTDFALRFSNAHPTDNSTFERLLSGLSDALPSQTPTGFAANLQLAAFFAPVPDLAAIYFLEVACRLWETGASSALMAAAADAAIAHTIRPTGPNVSRLTSLLIRTLSDATALENFAKIADSRPLGKIVVFVLEVSRLLGDEEQLGKARAFAEEALGRQLVTDQEIHTRIRRELAVAELTYRAKHEILPNGNDILNEWLARFPDDKFFSQILLLLFENQRGLSADLYVRALQHLLSQSFFGRSDTRLCINLVRYFSSSPGSTNLSQAVVLLKDHAAREAMQGSLETALEVFELLMEQDTSNLEDHRDAHTYFSEALLNRENTESLLYLIKQGHYFYILEQYYLWLRPHLATSEGPLSLDTLESMTMEDLTSYFKGNQEQILKIDRVVNAKQSISRDFFVFGRKFFHETQTKSSELEEIQRLFNQASYTQLSRFFEVILHHSNIPESLKGILQRRHDILAQKAG